MTIKENDPLYYELEQISHEDLAFYRKRSETIAHYLREHYYFAEQRKNVFDMLQDSIRKNTAEFQFNFYQRTTSFKYCLTPLSARGSILNETGGRFNIGNINPNIPKFAALYIAENKETAIREAFQVESKTKKHGLTDEDLTLINQRSLCIVAVNGLLEQTLDLTDKKNLNDFYKVINFIKLPKSLSDQAKKLKIDLYPEVKTLTQLYNSIFNQNYKRYSLLFDIPSSS